MKYLSKNEDGPNIATISRFLRLCFVSWPQSTEDLIFEMYDKLTSRKSFMDANTTENLILALSVTTRWKETLELLESVKLTCSPGINIYGAVIEAAFKNGDANTGWALATETVQLQKKPKPEIYQTWLNCCSNASANLLGAETLLNFLSEHNYTML